MKDRWILVSFAYSEYRLPKLRAWPTKVTYFIYMVALGAIFSKLSLTPRESPVRCVRSRSGILADFGSWNMTCSL